MGIIIAILLFSFIVIFHEMGHFLIAKANGIEVEEFALGMGPLLFSKEYKGTRYCLRLLPIGGACMMGEDDAVSYTHLDVYKRQALICLSGYLRQSR